MIISEIKGSHTIWIRFSASEKASGMYLHALSALRAELPYPALIDHAEKDGWLAQDDKRTRKVIEKIERKFFDIKEESQGRLL